ncbi:MULTISPECIES: PA2817 family protein [Pseudomonas]|nr:MULTISPECIES: PA2817 family protein [Pseudomonas]QTS89064.1 dehydrogenase [Pseudomonas khazarica]TNF09211.1 MAG: dehydrogenase [Pseudomonadales bacterium]WFC62335.1 dehydrogenase [Pseudomonas sp. REST10]HIQ42573.1 dehydrogenase [Pseudomonas oleovorans]
MMASHLEHHLALLNHLRGILVALGEAEQVLDDSHALFLERYDELLAELPRDPVSSQYLGQDLISQVFNRYPQIAHLVPRDLLWFFGGDCLHFMPDEEIALYQTLDERRFAAEENGEPFDWHQEKQLLTLPTDGARH